MLSSIYIVYTIALSFPCHIVFDISYFLRVADDLATMVNDESLMLHRLSFQMWLVHCAIDSIFPNVVAKFQKKNVYDLVRWFSVIEARKLRKKSNGLFGCCLKVSNI